MARGQTDVRHNEVRDGIVLRGRVHPGEVRCYRRVELDGDQRLAVHGYWLNADTRSYVSDPMRPVHHDKLVTEVPYPTELGLDALVGF
ncbi:hypothetical protein [Streptomyces sp. NPDC057616]|uniref:hypothetical protein n=1 Tax=Streptomyces sp. NPDC057616 TaxID=3346183 RepID=UPI00367E817B